MKLNLTEKDLEVIFDLAHREWLDDPGHSRFKSKPEKYLLARSYFKAVVAYLESKGYKIELKSNGEKQDKG